MVSEEAEGSETSHCPRTRESLGNWRVCPGCPVSRSGDAVMILVTIRSDPSVVCCVFTSPFGFVSAHLTEVIPVRVLVEFCRYNAVEKGLTSLCWMFTQELTTNTFDI